MGTVHAGITDNLAWKEESRKTVFTCPVFSVGERVCRSPDDKLKTFTVLDSSDWAIVIPVVETEQGRRFVMVKQWRPGAGQLSLEFPGGVFQPLEDPAKAAARELQEETGYRPNKIHKIGEFSPNPAIMSNRVYFFLAEELENTGKPEPDDDEYLETVLVDAGDVIRNMGQPPFIHALMGTALSLYLQKTQ
jgi:8-oxo-dGTP pyrophosphatase MutT (NUDIX family)